MNSNIDVSKLKSIIDNINIIDIRSKEDYDMGHIKGAINIPMSKLIGEPKTYLKEYERYYIYCNYGISSKKTCAILSNLGYDVVNIEDGYSKWQEENTRSL